MVIKMIEIEEYVDNLEKSNEISDLIISKQKELISILKEELNHCEQIINLLQNRLSKYEPDISKELAEQ